MKVLVIGGTGNVGSRVATGLAGKGVKTVVLSRAAEKFRALPSGVEGLVADLDDPGSLARACHGMDGVFLLVAVNPNETRQGIAAVQTAKTAGVNKIVYLSVYMPEGSTHIPHFASKLPVENAVKDSGLAYTILRPNNFYQNDLRIKDALLAYGIYTLPLGQAGLNRVDIRDIADCAVNALTRPGFEGRTWPVHGPEALTGREIAKTYSRHLGWAVRYGGDDLDAWEAQVRNVMPERQVRDLRVMYKFFQDHGTVASVRDLEEQQKILGHAPRLFDDFVKEAVTNWTIEVPRAA